MPQPFDKFLQYLSASQVLAPETAQNFIDKHPQFYDPADAKMLAREMVRAGLLSVFQADAIYRGRPHNLVLGEYVLLDKIGEGGMGKVFKAVHRRMDRQVALKILLPKMTSSPDATERFHREVKAAAKLVHPNIVTAYDAGETAGVHFLVMEFVDGTDLAKRVIKDGALSIEQAVDYTLQAAAGLEYAHKLGMIHRDIKPANLLLGKDGVVKISDMGLARFHDERVAQLRRTASSPSDSQALRSNLTQTGTIVGTVDFMPPEQALNPIGATHLCDIYALGCSLYFMLKRRLMYGGKTLGERILAHRKNALPTLDGFPYKLEGVFHRMVAKKPEDRLQSMSEVIAALGEFRPVVAGSDPGSKYPAPPPVEEGMSKSVLKAILDDDD
jgi:serine/threonine protein kinase